MACANQAWLAWRAGDLAAAEQHGHEALVSWRGSSLYPFQWAALWPLLAVATAREQWPEAVRHTQTLIDRSQQPLPGDLSRALEEACSAWAEGRAGEGRAHLARSLALAQEKGYL